MTEPAVEAVMRVLAGHQHRYSFDGSVDGDVLVVCQCGHQAGIEWVGEEAHKIHIAREVVAALDPVMRKAKAEALREAARDSRIRGDIGHRDGPDAWAYLEGRANRIEADRG